MPDLIASLYNLPNGTTFVSKATAFETEVGDALQPAFLPQVKVKRWENETNLSVRLVHNETAPVLSVSADNKIVWKGQKVEAHFYDLGGMEEGGGYEFEVVLNEPPKSNVVQFTIQTKGLDFFKQPTVSPFTGKPVPDNVAGSYAVYHKTQAGDYTALGGKNYKTGKFCHIYRPWIVDATGAGVWGDLNIDPVAGTLTVTIPQSWLKKAIYPVRHAAGLTFGYTTHGATTDLQVGDHPLYNIAYSNPVSDGNLTGITSYVKRYSTNNSAFGAALYSNGAGVPVTRRAYNNTGTAIGSTWAEVVTSLTYAVTSGTVYWFGMLRGNGYDFLAAYDYIGSGTGSFFAAGSAMTFPATATGSDSGVVVNVSIWGVYTASGISGTITGPISPVTEVVTGTVKINGGVSATLAPLTAVVSGESAITGEIATTLSPVTAVVEGTSSLPGITGEIAVSLPAVAAVVGGEAAIQAGVAIGLAPVAEAILGRVAIAGGAGATLVPTTTETVGITAIAGVIEVDLTEITIAATGALAVAAAMAVALEPVSIAAAGKAAISGTCSVSPEAASVQVSGVVVVQGSIGINLEPVSGRINAYLEVPQIVGACSATLAPAEPAILGALPIAGQVEAGLAPVTGAAAGQEAVSGTLAVELDQVAGTAAGTVGLPGITGAVAIQVEALSAAVAGEIALRGAAAAVLASLSGSVGGSLAIAGSVDAATVVLSCLMVGRSLEVIAVLQTQLIPVTLGNVALAVTTGMQPIVIHPRDISQITVATELREID